MCATFIGTQVLIYILVFKVYQSVYELSSSNPLCLVSLWHKYEVTQRLY